MSHFVLFAAIPAEEIVNDFAASVDTELTQRMLPYYEMTECSDYLEFSPDPDGSETNEDGEPGFYFNPNARWDWYSIGGRWPGLLWISESVREYLSSEGLDLDSDKEVAKGFRRVSGARIRDIRWDATGAFAWQGRRASVQCAALVEFLQYDQEPMAQLLLQIRVVSPRFIKGTTDDYRAVALKQGQDRFAVLRLGAVNQFFKRHFPSFFLNNAWRILRIADE